MNKSIMEKEVTMGKFLFIFFGININKARDITHKDLRVLIPYLEPISDYNFRHNSIYKNVNLLDYVRVKDKTNLVMYYYKADLEKNLDNVNARICCNDDLEFEDIQDMVQDFENYEISKIKCLLETIDNMDLTSMSKYELCQLEKRLKHLKKIVGYERNLITKNVYQVQKQLRKMKRRNKND